MNFQLLVKNILDYFLLYLKCNYNLVKKEFYAMSSSININENNVLDRL